MNARKMTNFGIAAATFLLVAATVQSQQEKVQDEDLLNLLDKMKSETVEPSEDGTAAAGPVGQAGETMEVAGAQVDEANAAMGVSEGTNAVMDDVVIAEEEESEVDGAEVDNLSMTTLSDDAVGISSENLISVRLNKVSLEEAISLFAQLSGANIIVPELTEAAQISVNLKNVEWRPALQSILDTYDYELYQRVAGSNVYSVRRRPAGAPEPQVVETFILKYATVPNAAELIRQLLPAEAKVSEFASRNMLVVKSTESSLGEVRAVLESIDTVRQQVYIESKFMELTDDAQKDLGINWQSLKGYGVDASANAVAYGKESSTENPSENLWNDLVGGSATFPGSGEYAIATSVLNADQFSVVLHAMQENKGVNIVSNPKIIVANEEPANISIVRKEPNLRQERQQALNDTPDTITYTLDQDKPFFEYGIKLDVIPSINTSSNITVQINPSLTRKFADKQAGDNTYPVIDEKSIRTIFNLASGQTAAIGGLTEATEAEEVHKVPVLGSIPLLGRLFSYRQMIRGQDETIIFVTVGLANTQMLDEETGMPGDAELARLQVIEDMNSRKVRDQGRAYHEAKEQDRVDDLLKDMREKEARRVERRERDLKKQSKKEA